MEVTTLTTRETYKGLSVYVTSEQMSGDAVRTTAFRGFSDPRSEDARNHERTKFIWKLWKIVNSTDMHEKVLDVGGWDWVSVRKPISPSDVDL